MKKFIKIQIQFLQFERFLRFKFGGNSILAQEQVPKHNLEL
jgi:hypothetical protein